MLKLYKRLEEVIKLMYTHNVLTITYKILCSLRCMHEVKARYYKNLAEKTSLYRACHRASVFPSFYYER
jgi:hypothetical protein